MTRSPAPTKTNGSSKTPAVAASPAIAIEAAAPAKPVAEGRAEGQCGPEEHARRARQTTVSDDQLDRAAAIFRAAGDLSRLKLLYRLCDGEWCVTELADAAGVGLSTVSQQLRLLRAERIVSRRRAGKHIFYSLADSHVSDLIQSAIEHAAEGHEHPHKHDD
jgi:DNA-binding transcriptional ArsR family regulator